MTIKVKNWKKFQHYKNRKPPWIKLHRELLDDVEFYEMRGDDFKYLAMLWIIASEDEEKEGNLPAIKTLAFRLRISEKKVEELLTRLNHWIISDASNMLADSEQDAIAETETETDQRQSREETEGETPPKKKIKTPLSEDWQPNGNHAELAKEHSINLDWEADKFRDHASANNRKQVDWNKAFNNWLRRSLEFGSGQPTLTGIPGEKYTAQESKQRRQQATIKEAAERLRNEGV